MQLLGIQVDDTVALEPLPKPTVAKKRRVRVATPKQVPVEKRQVESPLTERHIAILCTEIQRKNGWSIRSDNTIVQFVADEPCLAICQKLEEQQTGQTKDIEGLQSREIRKERERTLGVMRDLVEKVVKLEAQGKREYLDNLPSEIQHLVIQFMDWEAQLSATNLYMFLASVTDGGNLTPGVVGYEEAYVREFTLLENRVWDTIYPFPETNKPDVVKSSPKVVVPAEDWAEPSLDASGLIPAPALSPDTKVLPEIPVGIVLSTTISRKQKATERQQTREQIRTARIKSCLDQIYTAFKELGLSCSNDTCSGEAVNRVFHSITASQQNDLIERYIIQPGIKTGSRTRGNTPAFAIVDIALMLYQHDYDKRITPKIARKLTKLILAEIRQREKTDQR